MPNHDRFECQTAIDSDAILQFMSVLQVLHIPDERLRKVAKPVEEVNAEIQRIVDDMFETMYAEKVLAWRQPRLISINVSL